MKKKFFQDSKGDFSSKRLIGIPCGISGMLMAVYAGVAATFFHFSLNNGLILAGSIVVLFVASWVYLGLATWENIKSIIEATKK